MLGPITTKGETLQAVSVSAAIALAVALGWLSVLERPVADLFMRIPYPAGAINREVGAVVIDDRSIQSFGPAPWPRDRIAELVQLVAETQPTAVVLDTILSEQRNESGDDALQRALLNTEYVLAAALSPDGEWLLPVEQFGGLRVAAHAHAETDTDGIVRSVAATKQASGLALPALSIAAARKTGWNAAISAGQLLRPDFRLAPSSVITESAADLLQGISPRSPLTGRVVFIGYSASGVGDQYLVSVGDRNRPSPGVLVHAAVTSSLLRGGLLIPLPIWLTLPAVFLIAMGIQMLRTRSGRLHPRDISLVFVVILVATLALLWFAQVIVPTVALLLAVVSSAVVREAVESKTAQRETGTILRSLLDEEGLENRPAMPRGVQGRLELVRNLQYQLARDRNLRRTLLEGMNEGVALWDETGEPLVSNSALNDLWGYPPSKGEIRDLIPGADDAAENTTSFEADLNGRRIEIQLLSLGAAGHLGLVRDVTERSDLDRRRREMHRLVSHELKTPLASIAGFGEMLQTYDLSTEELQRVAGMIRGEADRLGEMVRSFLDIERLSTDHWEAERSEIDLGSLVTKRAQILNQAASSRSQTIKVNVNDSSLISGVEQLVSQLVDNLVGNALKFSPDGFEILVEVISHTDSRVELRVSDRGPGISGDSLPHLFERFYRVPGSKTSGSGLGLTFVKETADWHDATVQVDTEVGEGTCFSVLFPITGESG